MRYRLNRRSILRVVAGAAALIGASPARSGAGASGLVEDQTDDLSSKDWLHSARNDLYAAAETSGVADRPPESYRHAADTLRSFGAVADGREDDSKAVSAAKMARTGKMVDLEGLTSVASSLPDYLLKAADEPMYGNGAFKVSGSLYPMHGFGAIISHTADTNYQSVRERNVLIASDRSQAKGLQTAVIGSSRIRMDAAEHSQGRYGTTNCVVAIGSIHCDITGNYKCVVSASRYCEVSGQSTGIYGSLMTRTHGFGGMTDFPGRYDRAEKVFDKELPNANTETRDNKQDAFYNNAMSCAGVDMLFGSGNAAVASRGTIGNGDGPSGDGFFTFRSVRVRGSHVFAHLRNVSDINGTQTAGLGSGNAKISDTTAYAGVLWSTDIEVTGAQKSGIIASTLCKIDGENQKGEREDKAIVGCNNTIMGKGRGAVALASANVFHNGAYLAMFGSRGGESRRRYGAVITYTTEPRPAAPYGANTAEKIVLEAETGTGRFAGRATSGFNDFAELWPNLEPGRIEPGHVLVREGDKVAVGLVGDTRPVIGVLSATPAFLCGDDLEWSGKYVKDEWGRDTVVDVAMVRWPALADSNERVIRTEYEGRVKDAGAIPGDAEYFTLRDKVISPDWRVGQNYRPKSERPEDYSACGHLGRILTRIHEPFEVDDFIGSGGVVSEHPTDIVVLRVDRPFDSAVGYGIGYCYVSISATTGRQRRSLTV